MNPSYDNSFGSFQQPVVSAQGGNFQQVGGRKSRKWIIILIILVIIAIGLFAVIMINRNSGEGSAESIETSYWTYMNYLIKGEDSSEVLLEEDYPNAETAVKKNYIDFDEGYFEELISLFGIFRKSVLGQSEEFKFRYGEVMEDYSESLDYIIESKTVGVNENNIKRFPIDSLLQQSWWMEEIVKEAHDEEEN